VTPKPRVSREVPTAESLLATVQPETARRLLQSALDRFAKVGYHATTTRDICTGALLSPAALYVHYASKEDVLFHLSQIAHVGALATLENALGPDLEMDPGDRMEAVVSAFTSWHLHHVALARVAQYELHTLTPTHYNEVTAIRRQTERLIEEEIGRGVLSGDFDVTDVRGATRAVLALCVDVVRWFQPDRDSAVHAIARSHGTLARRMLGQRLRT